MPKPLKQNNSRIDPARICMFTQRSYLKQVARCVDYEFEDAIVEVDNVDLLMGKSFWWYPASKKIVNFFGKKLSSGIIPINPGLKPVKIAKDYDLFFAIFMLPRDLLAFNAIKGWRKRCQTAICWLDEIWTGRLQHHKDKLRILKKFDYVITNCQGSVKALQDAIKRPCYFIAPGIDAIKFCPFPNPAVRSIDVYNMGRRSEVTHQVLLEMANQKKIFYIYDTIHSSNMHPSDAAEHRSLVANIMKRSRFLLVNTAKIDRPFETQGQCEMGYRFFEGAAAGAVMIGEAPANDIFYEQFDWPNAVIPMAFDAANIAEILADLNSQPHMIEEISRNNVIQTLERNDWAYRWQKVLDIAGLESMPGLKARKKKLKKLAKLARASWDPIPAKIANTR